MIQIGTGFLTALSSSKQLWRAQKDHYNTLTEKAQEQAQALQEKHALQTAYLFRTAAERTRQAYENARTELASRQAKWAAHGLEGTSQSVSQVAQQSEQQTKLAALVPQTQLQTQAAQAEKQTHSALQKLAALLSSYRRASQKKSRFGSFGAAFASLFK